VQAEAAETLQWHLALQMVEIQGPLSAHCCYLENLPALLLLEVLVVLVLVSRSFRWLQTQSPTN